MIATEIPALAPFDPTRPVGEGITVLEASAGTGKTHAVASLVVAEVARGRPLDQLLVVTFTRKATGTLRERVWERLAAAVAALEPGARPTDDELLRHLAAGPVTEVQRRHDLLARALSDFDTTTIATTHGFCQQVLVSLGVAGDAERDVELIEDVAELVDDAVDDLFIRRFSAGGEVPFERDVALRIARAVVDNPDADIAHVDRSCDADVQRRRFALTLRRRIADQKRRGRLVTYDDLLGRLDASLADPVRGRLVADRLRRRFSMAVVDEFQDTDTVQWRILRSAFGAAPGRLVLVGDPKQAIYAFRGGDVHAYREATAQASTTLGLDVSWRSDQPLLDGLDALFAGARLGGPDIVHRPLSARPGASQPRLLGPAVGAPVTVRIVDRGGGHVELTPRSGVAKKSSARSFVADDLAGEAVRLLSSGAEVVERDGAGTAERGRPLGPGDLAVLVRTRHDAERVRRALDARGVPAVVHGGEDVLATEAGKTWLDLLRALEQPSSLRVRAVVAGPFFGWDATRLALAPEADWDEVDERLHDWGTAVRANGVSGALRRIEATGLTARLLGQAGGERRLSDLRQVAELLHARNAAHPSSAATLAGWLAEQSRSGPGREVPRRLESDADAVAVQTIHGAKGLEFPVVLLPSLWEGPWCDENDPPIFHDDQGTRCIGVGGSGQIHTEQALAAARERAEEELRLLYVALTRARHRVVLWWVTGDDAASSPFARVLLGRDPATGEVDAELAHRPKEEDIRTELVARAGGSGGTIAVEEATGGGDDRFRPDPPPVHDLDVRRFGRTLDHRWTRTSYSGLTAAAHDAVIVAPVVEVAEVDERAKVDEPSLAVARRQAGGADLLDPVPLAEVPGGARIGSLVHEILEHVDFCDPELPDALASAAGQAGAPRLLAGPADVLVAGLVAALSTPLGPLFDGRRLVDLPRADRLDELSFDLPLAGGDTPTGTVTMEGIAQVFEVHLPHDGPLRGYPDRLREPLLAAEVRGFLTGSIDVVARVGDRHMVLDYKTNRLAPPEEALTSWHYRPEAMDAAMQDAHYPLQAALYAVALHRYLRWRVPGYDPARHLGGVAYLFLRGMSGPGTPTVDGQPCGVFAWQPPPAFVLGLSDLLDSGTP